MKVVENERKKIKIIIVCMIIVKNARKLIFLYNTYKHANMYGCSKILIEPKNKSGPIQIGRFS